MKRWSVRGIRGAITVLNNNAEEILEGTKELLRSIVEENTLDPADISAAFFTVTRDLNAEFPAVAAREFLDWKYVPMICGNEIDVPDRLPKCIRVMVLVNTDKAQGELKHIYLRGATVLRQDLLPQ
ncbi:MAG: chorismate mutase [Peptococcaceae bacterium]|nr:chorismate mutase [Peptococcaceae bacterium]